jgi:hypothetical protein
VSITNIKDRLIVFFPTSTWEIVYTGNPARNFIYQRLNSELGQESTFSSVRFDRAALAVGQYGIMACNGANVERIDEKIISNVFRIRNTANGVQRVHGIRDFFNECVYWAYPNIETTNVFPNKVLLYNYRNGTWALLDDQITAMGYDENTSNFSWANAQRPWGFEDQPWDNPAFQDKFLPVLAGNQQGVCFKINFAENENAEAFYITNMDFSSPNELIIYSVDHNLQANADGSFILISQAQGANLGNINDVIFEVTRIVDTNHFAVAYQALGTEVYNGGGVYQLVSQISIQSKEFNLYQKDGYNCTIQKLQFNVDKDDSIGAVIDVGYFTNTGTTNLSEFPASASRNSVINLNAYALYPYERESTQLWRTVYTNVQGNFIQFELGYSDENMINPDISLAGFTLNSIMIHASPTSSRLQ